MGFYGIYNYVCEKVGVFVQHNVCCGVGWGNPASPCSLIIYNKDAVKEMTVLPAHYLKH